MRRTLLSAFLLFAPLAHAASGPRLVISPLDGKTRTLAPSDGADIASLQKAVAAAPRLRKPRLDLVHALVRAGRLAEARDAAIAWREHDAYNLVAVRQLGDILTSLGEPRAAQRVYSAIVELLPKEVEAHRALATLMKQAGDLEGARAQLLTALELAPADRRTTFELGDVEARLGHEADAEKLFAATIDADDAPEALRYPARQRLSQILASQRHRALAAKDPSKANELAQRIDQLDIHGGVENDIKVYLSWDTDRTDVDLWVITPDGEKVFYAHKLGRGGEALFDDVTTGYGPETFTAHEARPGDYKVLVDFFGSREAGKEARGEVVVITDEGRPNEVRKVFPYRLFDQKDTVALARVHVAGGAK